MRELFDAHREFEEERPIMRHSTYWYQERAGHEIEEWMQEEYDVDPEAFLSEAADVFLFWAATLNSVGVTPEMAHQAILKKMELNHQRFPAELFKEGSFIDAYMEAKAREGRPVSPQIDIYNPSVSSPENDHFQV